MKKPVFSEVDRDDGGKNADASKEEDDKAPSARTLCGLDWLNVFLADVQTGVGPFLAIYLAGYKWNEERVRLALTVGGVAGILSRRQRARWLTASDPNAH